MSLRLLLVSLLLVAASGCESGGGIPDTNVRDYNITFSGAEASASCTDEMKAEAAGHAEYTQTYRVHFVDGPDEERIDMYWKERGDADSSFTFFASGLLEGSLDDGAFSYAGGQFDEERTTGRVTYRVEGRARTRFTDELVDSTEDYIIVDSTDTSTYPVGCVYTLNYDGRLSADQDDSE